MTIEDLYGELPSDTLGNIAASTDNGTEYRVCESIMVARGHDADWI